MEDDIRADLSAAMEEQAPVEAAVTETVEVPAEVEATTETTEVPKEGRSRDEQGRFTKADGTKTDNEAEAQASHEAVKTETPSATPDLPPSTWTAAAKAEYATLSPVIRAEIKKRETDMQKGIEGYRQAAEYGHKINEQFAQVKDLMQQHNVSPAGILRDVLPKLRVLHTGTPQEKGDLLRQLATFHGADLGQQVAQHEPDQQTLIAQQVQQLLQPHLQQINQFQNQFQTSQQRTEQAVAQQTQSHIEAFRNAVDEKGQPKHIYFEDVRGLMGDFLQSGHAQTMDEAYAMACRAHPEVSTAVSAAQRKSEEAERLQEARRKAEEARRHTAVNATGQGSVGIASTSTDSLRADLEAAFNGGRV